MMDIGKSIFKEIENLPRFTVSCPPFLLTEEPMVRLSDLKNFLDTVHLEITGGSGQQDIEIEYTIHE